MRNVPPESQCEGPLRRRQVILAAVQVCAHSKAVARKATEHVAARFRSMSCAPPDRKNSALTTWRSKHRDREILADARRIRTREPRANPAPALVTRPLAGGSSTNVTDKAMLTTRGTARPYRVDAATR